MAGVKGKSGRGGLGLEFQITRLKKTLLDAIEKDCLKGEERTLFWAEKFVSRLMPQELTGGNGERLFPKPLLAGQSNVNPTNNSNQEAPSTEEAN